MIMPIRGSGVPGQNQSVVCLTGDQEVAGLNSAGSSNILSWRLIMK